MKKFLLGVILFFITSSVFATDKVITLKGASWSTFSTPKILSDISFSNTTGAGLSFYTLNNGTWQSVIVGTGTIKPLEGYMVYNLNPSNINIDLTYKQGITPQEALFTKNLKAGWNLLGVTSENTPFTTIGSNATMSVDFSDTTDLLGDLLGYTNIGRTFTTFIGNLNINNMTSRYGKSYGIFMSQDGVYGGSQNLSDNPTLTITRTDLIPDQSIAIGSSNKALLEYSMTANNVSDIKINFIQFKPTSESSVDNANITNFQLLINNTVLSTKNMINGAIDFNDLNLTIPKGSTVTVRVVADFSSNITDGQNFQLELLNIDARDSNSISISSINAPPNGVLYTFVNAGSVTMTNDVNNADNENEKTILAGDSSTIFSVDIQATNENVDVKTASFTLTGVTSDFKNAIVNASLYLGDTLVATNSNADITTTGATATIEFNDLTTLIVPTSSTELKLKLNTANIGYEKVGATVVGALVSSVSLTDADGVDSGKTVTITSLTVSSSKAFSIVPATVTTSLVQSMSSSDKKAKLRFTINSGNNTASDSNSQVLAGLQNLTFVAGGSYTGSYKIYVDGQSSNFTTSSVFGGQLIFDASDFGTGIILSNQTYVIEMNDLLQTDETASLTLTKEGVIYDVYNVDNSTGLKHINTSDIGLGSIIGD